MLEIGMLFRKESTSARRAYTLSTACSHLAMMSVSNCDNYSKPIYHTKHSTIAILDIFLMNAFSKLQF